MSVAYLLGRTGDCELELVVLTSSICSDSQFVLPVEESFDYVSKLLF